MPISSKERAGLRARAHHLSTAVHVGHQGVTAALLQSLDDALCTHELVKVQLEKQGETSARDAAAQLAASLNADVIQVIGRTTTLYRENPELRKARKRSTFPNVQMPMNDKQLKALLRKNAAKAERAKPKPRPAYDATLDATRPAAPDDASEADEIFREMKRREF